MTKSICAGLDRWLAARKRTPADVNTTSKKSLSARRPAPPRPPASWPKSS
jgi:hypothetical protein